MQLHIYEYNNGQNGAEYLYYDAKNFFLSKKFAQFPEDYTYSVGVSSLSIVFYKTVDATYLTNLINNKQAIVRIFLDANFLFNAVLDLVNVNFNHVDSSGNFQTVIQAKITEYSPLYTFLGNQASAYSYVFPKVRGDLIDFQTYMNTFFGYIGYTVDPIGSTYTIVPSIDNSNITFTIDEERWPLKLATTEHYTEKKIPFDGKTTNFPNVTYRTSRCWPLVPIESTTFQPDTAHQRGAKFEWKTVEIEMQSPVECLYETGDGFYLQRWFPQYSVNYVFELTERNCFPLTTPERYFYTIGCNLITDYEYHFWTHNLYVGGSASAGCGFTPERQTIAWETPGPICRELDIDPTSSVKYTDLIFWIMGLGYWKGSNSSNKNSLGEVTEELPPRPTGTATLEMVRRKANYTLVIWTNKMEESKNQDILEIFCRNLKVMLAINNTTKHVSFNNNTTPITCTVFSEPITFEWKTVKVKYDMTKDCCYIKEKFNPDPVDLIKEYDYKYYTVTFKTILSYNDFIRCENHQALHITFGNYTNNNLIITDIKNWNPETGLCAISAYDNTIHQTIIRSRPPNLDSNETNITI